ncbi:MAG: electron transport complex subunit RsxC [Planctomycetota bacterium]|nr:electron transport complex subunit RsxC [Planctomycetota bacterium]
MLATKTFKGGVHPPEKKDTSGLKIEQMVIPDKIVVPLRQHLGAPCTATVKIGDKVKRGDKIGEAGGFVSAPVHASISGEVTAIGNFPHPTGAPAPAVVITGDGKDEPAAFTKRSDAEVNIATPQQLKDIIKEAGIVGMGGAAFPTVVKLSPPKEKKIDTLIINGAECEPYLTADHRLMLEEPIRIVRGMRLLMKALDVQRGFVAVESNKPDAYKIFSDMLQGDAKCTAVMLPVKYPQGAEKQLIKALLDREVPSGGLPMDVGALVQNVGTAAAVADAVYEGRPLYERILTVGGGGIKQPRNLRVRIGTLFSRIIEFCGGLKEGVTKILNGGPMMGIAQYTLDVPVIKGTSGILALTEAEARTCEPGPCIRCGRCIDACPMKLVPSDIVTVADLKLWDNAKQLNVLDCIECGSCAYVCPAKRHFVQSCKRGKAELAAMAQKAQAAAAAAAKK